MTSKKTVFITGASSELMLGLVDLMDSEQFEIYGLTRKISTSGSSLINWIEADMLEPERYKDKLAGSDIIIHAAAITHSRDEEQYYRINVVGTEKLIDSIPPNSRPLFVLISSRVAGENSGAYGLSKLEAEEKVKETCANWLVFRISEVFGGNKSEGIKSAIDSALKGGIQPCPVGMKSPMYPIHMNDASKMLYETIFEDRARGRVMYVNGGEAISYEAIINLGSKISGRKSIIVPLSRWFLQLISAFASLFRIEISFVPDQIARLYSEKEIGEPAKNSLSLELYMKNIHEKKHR